MNTYAVEFTDTFDGEANYCWANRFKVEAENMKQAITKAKKREFGTCPKHTIDFNDGMMARIDINNACICAFIELVDEE